MRAVVLGAGVVGRAATFDLVRRGHEVVVADVNRDLAVTVAAEFDATAVAIDVTAPGEVRALLENAFVVIAAVPYRLGISLADAATESGTHYLDFGGNPSVVAAQLERDDAATAAGIALIPDGGLAPGLANVMAEDLIEQLGDGPIQEVRIRVGGLPQRPEGTLAYQLAFSPEGLVNEYAEPCETLRHGRRATIEPLTGFEEVAWERWGPLEAFATAGGTSTMCARWEGCVDELDYKTLRYPGHGLAFRAMYELGLFDERVRQIGDTRIAPRALLLDTLADRLPSGGPGVVLIRTWATAIRDGAPVAAGYQLEDRDNDAFSAMARTTAYPVTALADLLARGRVTITGAVPFHQAVTGGELLPELEPLGIRPTPWTPPD